MDFIKILLPKELGHIHSGCGCGNATVCNKCKDEERVICNKCNIDLRKTIKISDNKFICSKCEQDLIENVSSLSKLEYLQKIEL